MTLYNENLVRCHLEYANSAWNTYSRFKTSRKVPVESSNY